MDLEKQNKNPLGYRNLVAYNNYCLGYSLDNRNLGNYLQESNFHLQYIQNRRGGRLDANFHAYRLMCRPADLVSSQTSLLDLEQLCKVNTAPRRVAKKKNFRVFIRIP